MTDICESHLTNFYVCIAKTQFSLRASTIYFSFITQNKQNKSPMRNTFPVISEAPPPDPATVVAPVGADAEAAQNPKKGNVMGA